MAEHKLTLEKRDVTGKKLKNLRKNGMIPGVLYGGKEPVMVMSEYVPTEKVLEKAGYHSPIDLTLDGKKQLAIVKDVQLDPVSRQIVNVEYQAIKANEEVTATAPVLIVNFAESEASKTYHYELTQVIEELEVKAKPADLPEDLELDAAGLKDLDDKLTLEDLHLPAGVELADKEIEMDQVVASLYDPAAEAAAREKADAEAQEELAEGIETPEELDEAKAAEEKVEEAEKAE